MKTQKAKLDFKTYSLIELNNEDMSKVEGGSTAACLLTLGELSSSLCALLLAALV